MPETLPALPPDLRLYAIGDIHGCLDQLKELVGKIDEDAAGYGGTTRKIFLGDYIDRGLYSKQTIEFALELAEREKAPPIFILGNHEQVMRSLLRSPDARLLHNWFSFGGRETLLSYGITQSVLAGPPTGIFDAMAEKVPEKHKAFLEQLSLAATFGDYFFCHAGVRPGVPLDRQIEQDLTWIRYEFLNHKDSFGKVVVHGHTISYQAEFLPNRIGIDTGAYATGCLTALGLEGNRQWLVQTV
ncbi:MAG: serine/threonine protein phosphatase [Pseudomonadota bacterium]|nr:serine/threonine protein phosphatase [Pseudomonadota bacterium]